MIAQGKPVVGWQSSSSLVLSVIKTEVLFDCDDLANKDLLLQQFGERIEKLSQQDKWSKICMDAGFLNVVEIGQDFMTKDTAEFTQFTDAVACRACTLPRDEEAPEPKGLDPREHQKLGHYWKFRLVVCTVNMELRSELCPWTRTLLTPGSEFLMDQTSWSRIWTTMSRKTQKCSSKKMRWNWMRGILHADQRPKRNHKDENLPALPQELFLFGERIWIDVEPGEYSISDHEVSKKLIHLLRHGSLHRENDGAIEFWRIKENLQKHYLHCHHWSDDKWKKTMARGGGNKKRYQYCADSSGESCTSELFKIIQDAVSLILLYRTMLFFRATSSSPFIMSDVQSIYIPSSIRDWYLEVKIWATDRQYSFCLWIPWTKTIRILIRSTSMHRVMHNTCIKHGRDIRTR